LTTGGGRAYGDTRKIHEKTRVPQPLMKSLSLRNGERICEHHKKIWARGSTISEAGRQDQRQRSMYRGLFGAGAGIGGVRVLGGFFAGLLVLFRILDRLVVIPEVVLQCGSDGLAGGISDFVV
jgi:hypothetical protein